MKIRKRSMLIVPAAAALLIGAGVGPASAATSPNADCVGSLASGLNVYIYPGLGGYIVSQYIAPAAWLATDCHGGL